MFIDKGKYWECDGMCFSQSIVLNDIFSLQGIVEATDTNLGNFKNKETYYLEELTRLISTISIYSRNQLTSYFHTVDESLTRREKLDQIIANNVGANNALFSTVGTLVCPISGQKHVTFYDMIRKFCHIEKWKYPVQFLVPKITSDYGQPIIDMEKLVFNDIKPNYDDLKESIADNVLEVEVTKNGKDICSGNVEICRILPWHFSNAARIFITDCEKCQLVQADPEPQCAIGQ